MPSEMLKEAASKLREIADSLEGYAGEEDSEESSSMSDSSSNIDKIGTAAAAIRTKMK